MNTTHTSSIIGRRIAAAALSGAAAALAATILTGPAAHATTNTEQQLKDACAANGGTYATHVAANGNRVSQCCKRSPMRGNHLVCEFWVNGVYDGWNEYAPPPPDTTEPGPTPGAGAPVNPSGNDPATDPGGKKPPSGAPAPINPNNSTGKKPSGGLQ
jgi:hypothetical protein